MKQEIEELAKKYAEFSGIINNPSNQSDLKRAFIAGYSQAMEQPKWFDVKDGLPPKRIRNGKEKEESEYMLCFSENNEKWFISRYDYGFESWDFDKEHDQVYNPITHYQPLPPPPNQTK